MGLLGVVFEIQGIPGFKAALERASDAVVANVLAAEEVTALAVRDRARADVGPGDLADAINAARKGKSWAVGIDDRVVETRGGDRVHKRPFIYGAIKERGEHNQAANPFMTRAADAELPKFEGRVRAAGLTF